MGMAVASVLATSANDPWAEQFARRAGPSDLLVAQLTAGAVSDGELSALLPAGSTWLRTTHAFVPLRTSGDDPVAEQVELTDLDLAAPQADGVVEVLEGRSPSAGEVLLSPGIADAFDVEVGDRLVLSIPQATWTVSGIGRLRDSHGQPLAIVPDFDFTRVFEDYRSETIRVDVPTPAEARIPELASTIGTSNLVEVTNRIVPQFFDERGVDAKTLAWGWVAGTIALAAVGIIITAAFATSARRQLATIGQLSANGAPDTLVRRTLAMQGSWSGLMGAVLGVLAAGVALLVGRPIIDRAVDRDIGSYDFATSQIVVIVATAVVVATIAALLPARSAARVPVLAALAGRRPLGAVPRRLVPIGVGLFGIGLLALIGAAGSSTDSASNGDLEMVTAVGGGLAVLAGMCCLSPIAVDALHRVPAPGASRLATRGLVRHRTRSAAVVTAIAAVGALATAGATFAGQLPAGDAIDEVPDLPLDAAVVAPYFDGATTPHPYSPPPVPDDLRQRLSDIVPGARFEPRRTVWFEPPVNEGYTSVAPQDVVIADEPMLDLVGLSNGDLDALRRTGTLLMHDWGLPVDDGASELPVPTTSRNVRLEVAIRQDPPQSWAGHSMLMTEERVEELGWSIIDGGLIMRSSAALTAPQRTALGELSDTQSAYAPWFDEGDVGSPSAAGSWDWYTQVPYRVPEPNRALVEGIIIAVAVVLTLIVVAIGLSLAASEGRDERDVLVAVGARPALMRRLASWRAIALVGVAGLLAVPTGYLPVVVVLRTADEGTPQFPWITVAALLVAIPLLAAGVAWLGSSVAQRVRPVRMSTLQQD